MKKIMICVDLNNKSVDLLRNKLKGWDWKGVEEVHFVHGFQLQVYTDTFYFSSYPPEDQYDDIEKSVNDVVSNLEDDIFGDGEKPKVVTKCIFSNSPKSSLADYSQDKAIQEMIIGTRGIHGFEGLFSSSFAEYMVRHANCELRILRL